MTEFILYTGLALLSLSTLLYMVGAAYNDFQELINSLGLVRVLGIGYEVEE